MTTLWRGLFTDRLLSGLAAINCLLGSIPPQLFFHSSAFSDLVPPLCAAAAGSTTYCRVLFRSVFLTLFAHIYIHTFYGVCRSAQRLCQSASSCVLCAFQKSFLLLSCFLFLFRNNNALVRPLYNCQSAVAHVASNGHLHGRRKTTKERSAFFQASQLDTKGREIRS